MQSWPRKGAVVGEGGGQEGERQRGEPRRVRVGSRQEETQLDPWASG